MTGERTRALAGLGLGAALGPAIALVARVCGAAPAGAAALVLASEAAVVAAAVPCAAARERAPVSRAAGLGVTLGALAATLVLGAPRGALAPLAQLYLIIWAVALWLVTRAAARVVRPSAAQVAVTALALLALAFPYAGGPALELLPVRAEGDALHASLALFPLPALVETFAGVDLLRLPSLYESFHPGQDVLFSYATPLEALAAPVALVALLAAARALVRSRSRGAASVAGAVVVLGLVLLAPARPAHAQLFPQEEAPKEPEIGDMVTRIKLGYYVPELQGRFKIFGGVKGSSFAKRFDLKRDLHPDPEFIFPTFSLDLSWSNAGRVYAEYFEGHWFADNAVTPPPFDLPWTFRNVTFPPFSTVATRYQFRTIALKGSLDIPAFDFLTLRIVGITRYVHWLASMEAPSLGLRETAQLDAYMPAIGPGFDMFIYDKVYIYGEGAWLDFSYNQKDPEVQYRELHAGVRLELVPHAHVAVEFFALEISVKKHDRREFRQRTLGPHVMVHITF